MVHGVPLSSSGHLVLVSAKYVSTILTIVAHSMLLSQVYSTVRVNPVQYSTVQYSAVQCSTVQYSTAQYMYSTVQYSTVPVIQQVYYIQIQSSGIMSPPAMLGPQGIWSCFVLRKQSNQEGTFPSH